MGSTIFIRKGSGILFMFQLFLKSINVTRQHIKGVGSSLKFSRF
ncbi:hypothetical protein QWZ13_19620 [Reinekea marina]|nr:hypothetical protein [Reinekea marina]MDN3647560.1 hypothetical protein [Reinekea marina]MDN3651126.1 hypothetical protein [Reinekea marina]